MLKSIYNSYTGLRGFQQGLDTNAHNLSNLDAVAFKENQHSFQELVYREMEERRLPLAGTPELPPHSGRGASEVISKSLLDQGALSSTGRALDLAIEGDGYFRVQTPDGEFAYTRSGNFLLDGEGRVVTAEGYPLDSLLELEVEERDDLTMEDIDISADGTVYIPSTEEGEGEIAVGQIPLYSFTNPEGLLEEGGNLYMPSENSGAPVEGTAAEGEFGEIHQGFLEDSNVDLGRQMSELIKNQRSLQASSRALMTADEMWSVSLNVQV